MQVLVTGASGAIGAELVPRLARGGHAVRAFARDPARVTAAGVAEVVRGDAVSGAGLDEALEAIEVAYFLIHSMETALNGAGRASPTATARPHGASPRPRARAGVRRVVYLGGLVPADAPASPHLASRLEVEEALLARRARGGRAARLDRRLGPLALVPLPRAPRRARARSCRCRPGATIARARSTGAT